MPKFDEKAVAEYRRPFEEKGGDIFIAFGITPVEIGEGRAVMKMPFCPNTSQYTGVFAAGALISLADITATAACVKSDGAFPFSVQLNANLLRNTNSGNATAEALVVHSGRTMKVIETVVRDDDDNVLARVTTTHLIASSEKK
ncbi:MAG: PaaI family thioesterase [Candidatus Lokiarchaeota archaeon]|nr:PaaI family thioesterase [Candidatus Lokiarchaeota archaeon]